MSQNRNIRSVLTGNVIIVTSIILFSIYVIFIGLQLPTRPDQADPGPGFFPILVGLALILFALIELSREYRFNVGDADEPLIDRENLDKIAPPMIIIALYIILMPFLGFFIDSILFLIVLYWYSGVHSNHSIPISIGVAVIVFYIFKRIFRIPLPENVLLPISRLLPSLPSVF